MSLNNDCQFALLHESVFSLKKPLVIAMFGPPPARSTPLSALCEKWGIAARPHKVLSASPAGWPARHRLEPGTVIRPVARADQPRQIYYPEIADRETDNVPGR
jgi:hypothetical protein